MGTGTAQPVILLGKIDRGYLDSGKTLYKDENGVFKYEQKEE